MAYQSLYRKYRPQTFADVMGQEPVTRTLQNAIASGKVGHGYLFTGTRGTAKTTVARLLAKTVNCLNPPAQGLPEPCNTCEACIAITNGSCMDVIEMDAASHRGVADIEEVRRAVGFGPMQYRYKVFIIDEAHQLSSDAKDAFLKTLEEPPDNVIFILATTEPQAIPITIRSRCQQFDFRRGSLSDIAARIRFVLDAEKVRYDDEAVFLVARDAEGSWRDALSLLEQTLAYSPEYLQTASVEQALGVLDYESLAKITRAMREKDAASAFLLVSALLDAGKETRTVLRTLALHLRDLLLTLVGGQTAFEGMSPEERNLRQQDAHGFAPGTLLKAIETVNEALGELRWNNQHRLLLEITLLKLIALDGGSAALFATIPVAPTPVVVPQPIVTTPIPIITVPIPTIVPPVSVPPTPMVQASDTADNEEDADSDLYNEDDAEVAPTIPPLIEPVRVASDPPTDAGGLTIEQVQAVWPRFLSDLERASKTAAMTLAGVAPISVAGNTVTLRFTQRSSFEMVSNFKDRLNFLRQKLSQTMGREVGIEPVFGDSVPPTKPTPQKPVTPVIPAVPVVTNGAAKTSVMESAAAYTAPKITEPTAISLQVETVATAAEAIPTAATTTLMHDPLVEETLALFNGELVKE